MDNLLSNLRFRDDLEGIRWILQLCDKLIDESQPWKLAKTNQKDDADRLSNILNTLAQALRALSIFLYPYMPSAATQILRQLGSSLNLTDITMIEPVDWDPSLTGSIVQIGQPLFPRIDTTKPQGAKPVSETPASPQPAPVTPSPAATQSPVPATAAPAAAQPAQITIDDFMKIQLKAAKVLAAERVPKSEKLLKLQVSLGSEQRQIVAGIGKKYEPETLIGKTIVIVANLKPAKLMGIESQGMVLAAGDSEVRGLATFIEDVEPGTKVK